jgi:hypothetical protein
MAIKVDTDTPRGPEAFALPRQRLPTIRCRARFSAKKTSSHQRRREKKVKLALKLWVAITVSSFTLSEADAGAQ